MGIKEKITKALFGDLETGTTIATAELLDSPHVLVIRPGVRIKEVIGKPEPVSPKVR